MGAMKIVPDKIKNPAYLLFRTIAILYHRFQDLIHPFIVNASSSPN